MSRCLRISEKPTIFSGKVEKTFSLRKEAFVWADKEDSCFQERNNDTSCPVEWKSFV